MAHTATRYIGLAAAIERVLRELGGSADVDTVLAEVWKRYVEGGGPEKVTMRLFRHPAGYYWSPDAEEALSVLEAAGKLVRRGRHLVLVG
ncbi:hypothetical protein [Hyperthermus butylicus]|uniref:Uncharacterized protein n=1 Tax=Hyperthermus butylicus (strain DSM 5456 / JCM 9403 / PLM1-5) TaxID=415426 RepID=A2BKW6_HYPBU|nr:hypothetical protein [Hyperthermus butylicus]ABM80627.1 hypothetical protein Hbut_0774 [Hyperthermus butylicus DSM 5456]